MKLLPCVLLVILAVPCFSDSLDELTGAEQAAILREQTFIAGLAQNPEEPALLPRNVAVKDEVAVAIRTLNPTVLTESLYLYKKPAGASFKWTEAEKTALLNETLALSTLAGLQYYSASRKAMRTFYETSFVISEPSSKKALEDPHYSKIPSSVVIYARQKDLTFGNNVYQYSYSVYKDALIFVQQNLTALTAGIIPAVGKNKLRSIVAVIDAGDYLLVYAASFAKTVSLPSMRERIGQSFSTRADAVLQWFKEQADKAYGVSITF
jgi:hypothetical protein